MTSLRVLRFLVAPVAGLALVAGPAASAEPVVPDRVASLEARIRGLLERLESLERLELQQAPVAAQTGAPSNPSRTPPAAVLDVPVKAGGYDAAVAADGPAFFMAKPGVDAAGGAEVVSHGTVGAAPLPDGSTAAEFDGTPGSYLSVESSPVTQILPGQALTVEAWLTRTGDGAGAADGDGPKAAILGVGEPGAHSWHWRLTGATQPDGSASTRANRLAAYAFNPGGGLGSGSYVQPLPAGEPVHVVSVYDDAAGTVTLYVNGERVDHDEFADYGIKPQAVNAPFRVGSANDQSGFAGAIGKVAVYAKTIPADRVAAHYKAMVGG